MATDRTKPRAHYYKRHIGDYKTDAGHLTMLKDGAYTRLLDLAYSLDGRLPGDIKRICAIARACSRAEEKAITEVLEEFFELRDGSYRHDRVDRELEDMRRVSQRRQGAAQARWAKDVDANALQVESKSNAIHKPLTKNQDPPSNTQSPSSVVEASAAGRACRLMRDAGCVRANPSHPDLLAALAEGVTPEELAATAREGVEAGKTNPFPWALATARSRRAQPTTIPQRRGKGRTALPGSRACAPDRYPRPAGVADLPSQDPEAANG